MSEIELALQRLFDRHRLVVWSDGQGESRAEFDAAWTPPGVEKIVAQNNELAVKYRILRAAKKGKFLLYRPGPPPPDEENWLLDVELAAGVFRFDQAALWLVELGLGAEFLPLAGEHEAFLREPGLRAELKARLSKDDSAEQVRLKMLAVAVADNGVAEDSGAVAANGAGDGGSVGARLDAVLERLLDELAAGGSAAADLIERAGLGLYLWPAAGRAYSYQARTPGILDFALKLFESAFRRDLGQDERAAMNPAAARFLKRWKDNVHHRAAFAALAEQLAPLLDVDSEVAQQDVTALVGSDLFPHIDRRLLADLIAGVSRRALAAAAVDKMVERRRAGAWFDRYADLYEAVAAAACFLDALGALKPPVSAADALRRYSESWYEIDQHYRHFVAHRRRSGETTPLAELGALVENHYNNTYLLALNDAWQAFVDAAPAWDAPPGMLRQDAFFERVVRPYGKVVVIISDALRYEVGVELQSLIRREDRYTAEIEPLLTLLPSYTPLGMAALLPHTTLAFTPDGQGVLVDGQSSQGTDNRAAILLRGAGGTAKRAEEFLKDDRETSRALIRDNAVVYIYHNRIDAVGDDLKSEERVFEAVAEALAELIRLIKKLAAANVNNILITADHGFLYQQTVAESDFVAEPVARGTTLHYGQRCVLGHGLRPTSSFRRFTAAEVGLAGEMDILIPKSINRLRVQGASRRYVHGGAALQEVVVPVLRVNKKRQTDVEPVAVEIMRAGGSAITTGQVTFKLYQTAPVSEKRPGRTLLVGLYTAAGALISDEQTVIFDRTDADERRREMAVTLRLTAAADAANNQEVQLRLRERIPGAEGFRPYGEPVAYTLRRAFDSDFDF